jgi:hypothetical protein
MAAKMDSPDNSIAVAGRAVGIQFNNKRNMYPTVQGKRVGRLAPGGVCALVESCLTLSPISLDSSPRTHGTRQKE